MIVSKETNGYYPDLDAAGGLASALQGALRSVGSPLTVTGLDPVVKFVVYARVEFGSRFSQVYIAAEERLFLFDCWNRGVCLAHGATPTLVDLARAIDRWVGSDCTTAELAAAFGFVTPEPRAAVYERGGEVGDRWQGYLAGIGERFPELAEFVAAAAWRPELRRLFPFTSLNTFCFSRCTGYPFTRDIPHVTPLPSGGYQVAGPDGRVLGRGNGEEAAELVVRHLPPGCGPAVAGTAEDLARAEPPYVLDHLNKNGDSGSV
jgi:hypothetical protein